MKKTMRILSLMLCLCMLLACFTACGDKEESGAYAKVMLSTNVMSLDSNLATDGESFEVIADCIDGLTQMDESGAAIPAIAESWTTSDDGLTWTFNLRKDAKWSNGDSVTANDFVYAWRKAMTDNEEYGYMFGNDVGCVKNADKIMAGELAADKLGVTAKDDYTLVVELEAPVSFFTSLMYFPSFYPLNEKFYEGCEAGTYGTSPATFLSNGAFLLEDYTPGTASLTLKKNPDYYDADKVKLGGIIYQVVGSADSALTAFKSGNLDVATISGDQVDAAKNDTTLASSLKVTGAGYMWYMTFSQTANNANGYLANVNLREAFAFAIDRELLVNSYVKDGSIATYTAVPPQFAASALTGEDFSADQTKFSDYIGYDVAKAQEFLAKAKEELGVESFSFTLIFGNNEGTEVVNVATSIKEQIEANLPGVTITLSPMAKRERLDKMQNDNYEIALTRWGPDYADPMTYLGMWTTGCSNNYGFWSSAEYDQLITDCTTGKYNTDYAARWAALYEAETLVMKDVVITPLYTKANANLISSSLTGVEFHPVALNRVFKNAEIAQ